MKNKIISLITSLALTTTLFYGSMPINQTKAEENSIEEADKVLHDNPQETIYNEDTNSGFIEQRGRYDSDYNLTSIGNVRNLVVFIRFKGQNESTVYSSLNTQSSSSYANGSIAQIENAFNAPYYSLKGYTQEISNGKFSVTSDFYPKDTNGNVITYEDANPLGYYLKYSDTNSIGYSGSDGASRKGKLMQNALNSVASQVNNSSIYDINKDGIIDYVTFVVPAIEDYGEVLWPSCITYLKPISIDKLGLSMRKAIFITTPYFKHNSSTPNDMYKSISHEAMHMIGMDDMYDPSGYTSDIMGGWTVMTDNYGHPTVYEKYKYGKWIDNIKNIDSSGEYTISPNISNPDSNNIAYKISIPGSDTYYMLEYRKKGSTIYENDIPKSGLLVYKVNPNSNGNTKGEPYEVVMERPSGKTASDAPLNSNNKSYTVSLTGEEGKFNFKIEYLSIQNEKLKFKVTRTEDTKQDDELKILSMETTSKSPQKVNTLIRITTTVSGGYGNKKYYYKIKDISGNIVYSNTSLLNYIDWVPTKESNYLIECEVTDQYENSAKTSQVFMISNFVLTSFNASIKSPQETGQSIVLSAGTNGGNNVQYKFLASYNNTVKTISDFSSNSKCVWKPTSPGKYKLIVQAKNNDGRIYEKEMEYQINKAISDDTLMIQGLAPSVKSPQEKGQTITLTGEARGNGELYYRYTVYLNENIVLRSSYSKANTIKWTPDKTGMYEIKLEVKDSTGNKLTKSIPYYIVGALKINSISTSIASPQVKGKTIVLKSDVKAEGKVYYRYKVYLNGNITYKTSFSELNSASWKPTPTGTYKIRVEVKDSFGRIISKDISYKIINVVSSASNSYSKLNTSIIKEDCLTEDENKNIE